MFSRNLCSIFSFLHDSRNVLIHSPTIVHSKVTLSPSFTTISVSSFSNLGGWAVFFDLVNFDLTENNEQHWLKFQTIMKWLASRTYKFYIVFKQVPRLVISLFSVRTYKWGLSSKNLRCKRSGRPWICFLFCRMCINFITKNEHSLVFMPNTKMPKLLYIVLYFSLVPVKG